MPQAIHPIIETRRDQMFPVLEPAEIDRLARFGERKFYAAGARIFTTGHVAPGAFVILAGRAESSQHRLDRSEPIVTHGPGSFMGELAQLSGRPSLVDEVAVEPVEALAIPPRRLRDLLVEEAELGERIMRALILRRVALLETGGGGPIIVGSVESGDVLRLEGFLARNGHPHQRLDPATDPCAQALIERFRTEPHELPIVLCPNGKLLRNPSDDQLARCLGLVKPLDPDKIYDVVIVGAGPAGLAASVYAASEGLSVLVLDCRAFGGQAGASARIENYLGFPTGITGMALMGRAYSQAQKFGADMAIPRSARIAGPTIFGRRTLFAYSGQCGAGPSACRHHRKRGTVPPSQGRQARRFRGLVGALLGVAIGGAVVHWPRSGAGRRRQFRRPGGGVSVEPGCQGLAYRPRVQP